MNRYSKALKHIKSTQLEEKIKKLEESTPTNNTDNLYSTNPQGFNDGPPDPAKAFYPDQDGDWPSGIPGDEDAASYLRPPGFWTGEVNWDTIHTANVSQDLIGSDGKSTEGVIAADGTVKTILPENTRDFILGPLVDGYVPNHTHDAYCNIGYIQKDTRQFVLLGRITGQWKAGLYNPGVDVWDGGADDFTSYNENFTLAHAQWFQAEVVANNYVTNAPYFYSGGVPQQNLDSDQCPTCPSGMKGGVLPGGGGGGNSASGDSGGAGWGTGGTPDIGDDRAPGTSGNAGDVGLWGLVYDNIKGAGEKKGLEDSGVNDESLNSFNKWAGGESKAEKLMNGLISALGKITKMESAANLLNMYDDFLKNPPSDGQRLDATSQFSARDLNKLQSVRNDSNVNDAISKAIETANDPNRANKLVKNQNKTLGDLQWEVAGDRVTTYLQKMAHSTGGLDNSLHNNVQIDREAFRNSGGKDIVIIKNYQFRPGGSVAAAEKTALGKTLMKGGVELDSVGAGNPLVMIGAVVAAKTGITGANKHGGLYKSPSMPYKVVVPTSSVKGNSYNPRNVTKFKTLGMDYEPEGQVISESRKIKILKEVKKPYKMPEIPKQKYKMNFSGKYSAQNTPDKTASKVTDALIASGNDKGHRWRTQDKYWQGYETTERMNIVYDKLGHSEQAWNMITEKNGWKDREIQEHLNILAHEKQMLKENPLYESPFYVVEDNEPQSYEKDPLYKKVKDKLNKELHYKDRPSVKGYPNEPPPEMVNGWHPKFGKRYKYDKLDPQSAEAMPDTGDPEIDVNIEKATDKKAKTRKSKVLAGKTEQFSNWRDDLTDA